MILEPVADGLHFPTSLAFDEDGVPHVAESGLPFGGAPPGGRVLRLGERRAVLAAGLRQPVNGLLRHDGAWIVSEGGRPGRLSRLSDGGQRTTLRDDLPGFGNYQTNMAVAGADGWLYFSQGTMTNLGVIGLDSFDLGWLGAYQHAHDIPGYDIVVSDATFSCDDPQRPGHVVHTGAFSPFGEPGTERHIAGQVPCTGAVLRCRPDGSDLELVAWGLRNAYGLLVLPNGALLATDQGADDRGSRPIGNAPDLLCEVIAGRWYGWPDFVGTTPVSAPRFRPTRGPQPQPILRNHDALPELVAPLLELPVNCAATKMARIPSGPFEGQILVCLFGDERPLTGPPGPKVGRSLARVDLSDRSLHPLRLRHPDGTGLHRPMDVQVHSGFVYVLDFGRFEMSPGQVEATPASGTLSRFPLSVLEA